MTATNHAIAGSIIVAAVGNPLLGLPVALISHFALDALPHFGAHTVAKPSSKQFRAILVTDGTLLVAFLLLASFAAYRVDFSSWWLIPLGGILGTLPDLMWLKHYRSDLRGEDREWDMFRSLHKRIQQWELAWGWIIEVIWFVSSVFLLNRLLFT